MSFIYKLIKLIGLTYALMFIMLLGVLVMTNVMFWTLT